MKRFSSQADRVRRLAIFCFFALSILLFTGHSDLLRAGKAAQTGWRFEIEQGKKSPSNISIHNVCKEPHLFGIKSKTKYINLAQPTETVLIGPDSTELVNFEFDATGLETGVYRDEVIVECLDCEKKPGCQQDRNELLVEMTVVKASVPTMPTSPDISSTQDDGSGLNRIDVSAGPVCTASPRTTVRWWPMESLPIVDIVNGHNPSDPGGVSIVPGMVGNGVTFATGGFIEMKHLANFTPQQFTLDAWVKPTEPGPNRTDGFGSVIIVKSFTGGYQSAGLLYDADTQRFLFIFGNIHTELIKSRPMFPLGSFYYVAGTYDGDTFRLYVNGQSEGAVTKPKKKITYSGIPWAIGSSATIFRPKFPRTWKGVIDEVGIYSNALSACEIQAIFIAGSAGKCKP